MLSSETEDKLVNLILTIAQLEKSLENIRQVLSELPEYEPYAAFQRLDREKKKYITATDINKFLAENEMTFTDKQVSYIIKQYSGKGGDSLTYKEFLKIVLPLANSSLRIDVTNRKSYPVKPTDTLSYNIEYSLAKLFSTELEMHEPLEKAKEDLMQSPDFSLSNAFKTLDTNHSRNIDYYDINDILTRKTGSANKEDNVAFIRRLDRDLDSILTWEEFQKELMPVSPKTKIRPSFTSLTKLQRLRSGEISSPSKFSKSKTLKAPSKKSSRSNITFKKHDSKINTDLTPSKNPSKIFEISEEKSQSKSKDESQKSKSVKQVKKMEGKHNLELHTLMKEQIAIEVKLNTLKENLANNEDATIPSITSFLDPDGKGKLEPTDMHNVYVKLGMDISGDDCITLFGKFGGGIAGSLQTKDLVRALLPENIEEKKVVQKELSKESKDALKTLFEAFLESSKKVKSLQQHFKKSNVKGAPNSCDIQELEFFTKDDVIILFNNWE